MLSMRVAVRTAVRGVQNCNLRGATEPICSQVAGGSTRVILVGKTGRGFFSWREGVAVRVGTAALGYRRECGFVPAGCDPTPAAGNHRFPGRECRFISSPPTVLCR